MIELTDLTEPFPYRLLPWLDRDAPELDGSSIASRWYRDGLVILRGFFPETDLEPYVQEWLCDNYMIHDRPGGYPYSTPYMHRPHLRDLVCHRHLAQVLEAVIGEKMAVHLNLSGWRSTTRDWHQDGYLNPDHVADHYAAVWIALDDIHPDSGPFEYIPGSHRLIDPIRQDRMLGCLHPDERGPLWPTHSERILTPLFEDLIAAKELEPVRFEAMKGDVLIWHPRLLHRGTVPRRQDLERRALIAHYSGVSHRPDMPAPVRLGMGGYFFPIHEDLP